MARQSINTNITTTVSQSYHSAVTLGANAALTTTNSAVVFDTTIDRDASARNLTINAGSGAITLNGIVGSGLNGAIGILALNTTGTTTLGGSVAASSLTTNASGTTVISGGSITTTAVGGQVFNDAVALGADAVLDAGTGAVTFASNTQFIKRNSKKFNN